MLCFLIFHIVYYQFYFVCQNREIEHLSPLKHLTQLDLHGNPLTKDEESYKALIKKNCTHLYLLDNVLIKKKSQPKDMTANEQNQQQQQRPQQQQRLAGNKNKKTIQQEKGERHNKKRKADGNEIQQAKEKAKQNKQFKGTETTSQRKLMKKSSAEELLQKSNTLQKEHPNEHKPAINLFDKKAKEMKQQQAAESKSSIKRVTESKKESVNQSSETKQKSLSNNTQKENLPEEKDFEIKETVKLLPVKTVSKSDLIAELQKQYDQAYTVNSW